MAGKTRNEIKKRMIEAEIPDVIQHEKLPAEEAAGDAKDGDAAAGAKPEEKK